MNAVDIREVGPRDGLQIEEPIPIEAKLAFIDALVATGVRRIEATSFVSPRAIPALADAEAVAAQLDRWPGVEFSALVAGLGGVRRALTAGVHRLEYVVSASDGHSRANVGRDSAESIALIDPIAEQVHAVGGQLEVIIAIAFDCPFDGRTPPERVAAIAARAVASGADSLAVADTVGTASPVRTAEVIDRVRAAAPDTELGIHLHNTRGQGLANAWAAYEHGVRRFDSAAGGLGGCPFAPGASGNIATEELAYSFDDGGIETGIDIDRALDAARLISRLLGKPVDSNLLTAGGRLRPSNAASQ
ncbi:hydroxymethylglutaryl-CoA lyase [Nocardia sp. 852002-20019_SCH5090214]|jgi:hydroxymethylglutaryl-CoA lyase|uniref:Hydroxymethylglutaryl-CoA lyase n=1 Tax=Nocardia nova TaxID=37330 RepID=A0A2S6A4T2_9NOCA|nr:MULTISPECIES: hydroxymethylglutaryl-CoA lyase [Nocardia]OBF80915.1 hydroxymethylglutaryl-CoA lyase [Mycobacterium sp. 852002-51759_SCH5129042]MBF6272041.1 hydroxymethylglutaryl-CoA lyase [Nocardia nova]OBA41086.1 hydroxymethylglutaryl-CoA lyase [Nocardia sp. 852002-51101_SCH5132738]OBA46283.1 hydroxymethylglutaryl-CoA lyase [Nocardia sp. 852002-20019_SCH5090214]OBB54917.1 hydroxymethylglutaryl-CoA lyase [Nocardia sp. 852002-51244_SCH5132740]